MEAAPLIIHVLSPSVAEKFRVDQDLLTSFMSTLVYQTMPCTNPRMISRTQRYIIFCFWWRCCCVGSATATVAVDPFHSVCMPPRGGSDENDATNVTATIASSATSVHSKSMPPQTTAFLSLFQLGNQIKAEAVAAARSEETRLYRQRNKRGGALVKQPPQQQARSTGFWRWMQRPASVDAAEMDYSSATQSAFSRARQQAERLWWNNAWMDHIPPEERLDDDQDEMRRIENAPNHRVREKEDILERPEEIRIVLEDTDSEDEIQQRSTIPPTADSSSKSKKKRKRKHKNDSKAKNDPPSMNENQEALSIAESALIVADTKKHQQSNNLQLSPSKDQARADKMKATESTGETVSIDSSEEREQNREGEKSEQQANMTIPSHTDPTPYTSSGAWVVVDNLLTIGLASRSSATWKPSYSLRPLRKSVARATGLHGVLSGKPSGESLSATTAGPENHEHAAMTSEERQRLAAIDKARGNVARVEAERRKRQGGFWGRRRRTNPGDEPAFIHNRRAWEQEKMRRERLHEIDSLQEQYGLTLARLAAEKELLLKIPNPLWNYTTTLEDVEEERRRAEETAQKKHEFLRGNQTNGDSARTSTESDSDGEDESGTKTNDAKDTTIQREFNFPSDDLVDEYLDMLFSTGRIVKLNHTVLWRNNGLDDLDNSIDDEDEWLSAQEIERRARIAQRRGETGSRWLRNGLGEKIGLAVEMVAYKAVCANVMGILAKSLSAMHGVTIMGHSDICLQTENVPVLPPLVGAENADCYASQAIQNALRKTSSSKKKKRKRKNAEFVQRNAVTEQLLSQCQIATPLLKLFPLAWQRALIGNLITMITSILSDFFEGLEFEILGHKLSMVFKPITEQDMIRKLEANWLSSSTSSFQQDPARSMQAFEAAVDATTASMASSLHFLDKWHERVLGGDQIRTQVAALIARVVLSLVDDILTQSRMDLWPLVGGPKLLAGLMYRTPQEAETNENLGFEAMESAL